MVDQSNVAGTWGHNHWTGYIMPFCQYVTFEMHLVAQSAGGVADGQITLWEDDVQIYQDTAADFLSSSGNVGWNGFQTYTYWGGQGDTKTVNR